MSKTLSTLRSYIEDGFRIHAYHEVTGCNHGEELDLVALANRLGPDFDLVENHSAFLASLKCSRCAQNPKLNPKGNISIRLSPPTSIGAGKNWDTSKIKGW